MFSIEIANLAAVEQTVRHVNSAMPDAPVVPGRRRARPHRAGVTIGPARAAAARGLRRLADAVAPGAPRCTPPATAR